MPGIHDTNGLRRGSPHAPERFEYELVRDGSSVRVAPVGELDLATREHVERAIDDVLRSGIDHLILDLRRLSFMDSSGLRLALDLHAAASGDGFVLELIPGPPNVQRVFEITGTLAALPFRTSSEASSGRAQKDGSMPRA